MSDKATLWAWAQDDLAMNQSIVLLALGDFLDEGRIVGYIPMDYLVVKSKQSREQVLARLQELKGFGLVKYDLELIPGKLVFALPVELDEVTAGE